MASPRGGDGGSGQAFPRGGKVGGRGRKGGSSKIIPCVNPGVFKRKENTLFTKNMIIGDSVYGEKLTTVIEGRDKIEYRQWNPFRSKIAAAILCDVGQIYMPPGSKVLYLGAASGTTVSHVSDIVGLEGLVYAVEFAPRPGRDLIDLSRKRRNIIPIIEDARYPRKYCMLIKMVDTIFADVAQPNQADIVGLNAQFFLKDEGHVVISIKANCIDRTDKPEVVFANEVTKMKEKGMEVREPLSLEPYQLGHAVVVGIYRPETVQW